MAVKIAGGPADPVQAKPGQAVFALTLCALIAMMDGADSQSLAIAAPLIGRALSIQPDAMGLVFSAGLMGAALGAIGCGQLADRFGPRRVLIACAMGFGVFQFATAYVTSFPAFLGTRIGAGVGLGGATPCFLALAAANVSPRRRSRLLGFMWAAFPLGGFVGGLVNRWFLKSGSWSDIFLFGGILPVLIAAGLLLVGDPPSRTVQLPRLGVARLGELFAGREASLHILLTWAIFFAAFGSLAGVVSWVPSFLTRAGLPPTTGAATLSWHALGALASMAAAGLLVERFQMRPILFGLAGGAILMALLGGLIASAAAVAVCMVLLGLCLGVAASGAIAVAGALFPPAQQATGLGWSMGAGRIGQMILPFLMGLQFQKTGSPAVVLATAAILPATAALAALALSRTAGLKRGRPAAPFTPNSQDAAS